MRLRSNCIDRQTESFPRAATRLRITWFGLQVFSTGRRKMSCERSPGLNQETLDLRKPSRFTSGSNGLRERIEKAFGTR
jgi:hypothetical protein